MSKRRIRWVFFLAMLGCLAKILFGREPSAWAVAGFFVSGAIWYGLTWLRTRELDAPRPR